MCESPYMPVAREMNRINVDSSWTAEDAAAWCMQNDVTPTECVRLIRLTAGHLPLMVRALTEEGWRDGEQL